MTKAFLDTNVLVYAVSEGPRTAVAEELLAAGHSVGVQSLNEFVDVARRKLKMDSASIESALSSFRALCGEAVPVVLATHDRALKIARRHGLNIYDALIVAAAVEAGCSILYSEALQAGRKIDGLKITNPFG